MVFCSGMPRSASRWSLETCEELEKLRTPKSKIDCGYLGESSISGKGQHFVDAFVSNAIKENHDALIFQSHIFGDRVIKMILGGMAKNIYTFRDPRDSIASLMRNHGSAYEPAFDFVHSSLLLFDLFSEDRSSLLLPFPETINDPVGTTAKIARYLDFDLTDLQIENVHSETERLANNRRKNQRRSSAHSTSDVKIIIRNFKNLKGYPDDPPRIDNPWRYSTLNELEYADATKRLRNWLTKMGFSTSPVPPWETN
jgi:hypothetical protein